MKILVQYTVVHNVLNLCVVLQSLLSAVDASELQCNRTCFYQPSYKHADCINRSLSSIPPECSSSVYLDFRHNELLYLDRASLADFDNLRYLYLESNSIGRLDPDTFQACQQLREIFLQNNPLVSIGSQTFNGLRALRNLYLTSAQLIAVAEDAFAGLFSLERLFLNYNALRSLPRTVFQNLQTLQYLMLSSNELQSLYLEQFEGLVQLKQLDLQNNQLTRLGTGLIRGLLSLKTLNLSRNTIYEVQYGALDFTNMGNLETIDISYNNIVAVNNISELVEIPKVFLAGNPMQCDCRNELLMKWYEKRANSSLLTDKRTEVICHGPDIFIDIPMKNISRNVIASCKGVPQSTRRLYNEVGSADRTTSITWYQGSEHTLVTGDSSDIPSPIAGEISRGNTQEESKLFMFVGIAAVTVCAIVVVIGVVLVVCKRFAVKSTAQQAAQDEEKKTSPPPPSLPIRITENPLPDEPTEDDEVYEQVANIHEFPLRDRQPRNRLISEKSVDSAFSEMSSSGGDEYQPPSYPPPSYPPPPPPDHSMQKFSGYIPVYRGANGEVYLCTQCPHSVSNNAQPILMHSASVPAHCSDIPNYRPHSKSQPPMLRQNSLPERREHQSHYVPSHTSLGQVTPQHGDSLPCYAQPLKHRFSNPNILCQNQLAPYQTFDLHLQNEDPVHDDPPIPLQTVISDYSKRDLSSYPSTNPFSIKVEQSNQHSTQPRRVSFSNVTTVHTQDNPMCT